MKHAEARYLVSSYYAQQDLRKRFENQERAMAKAEEPHDMVSYMAKQARLLEGQIKTSLDVYSYNHIVGAWLRANKGVGPVIAAGLLAHIDITRSPTAGHIRPHAGLDHTMKWYGKGIKDIIGAARQAEDSEWDALVWLARAIHMRPSSILQNSGLLAPGNVLTPEQALVYLTNREGQHVKTKAEFHADNILGERIEKADLGAVYQELYKPHLIGGRGHIRWDDVAKALAKRPWNSELKTLCWKVGESFKKVSVDSEKRPASPYGLVYRERKALEVQRNDAGEREEVALEILRVKKVAKTTDAYYWYSGEWVNNPRLNPVLEAEFEAAKGKADPATSEVDILEACIKTANRALKPKLPPAHIDSRASRVAVKLFLSHFHEIA